ncbi:uncharacterized protein UDID_17371 [Ustilago sp. UG-2017a]|nr:uncharacterized protein UDID_17371 [Ustilago sp. UG-2017a]
MQGPHVSQKISKQGLKIPAHAHTAERNAKGFDCGSAAKRAGSEAPGPPYGGRLSAEERNNKGGKGRVTEQSKVVRSRHACDKKDDGEEESKSEQRTDFLSVR